jgi:hypothetical protein
MVRRVVSREDPGVFSTRRCCPAPATAARRHEDQIGAQSHLGASAVRIAGARCGRLAPARVEFIAIQRSVQIAIDAESHPDAARDDGEREFVSRSADPARSSG